MSVLLRSILDTDTKIPNTLQFECLVFQPLRDKSHTHFKSWTSSVRSFSSTESDVFDQCDDQCSAMTSAMTAVAHLYNLVDWLKMQSLLLYLAPCLQLLALHFSPTALYHLKHESSGAAVLSDVRHVQSAALSLCTLLLFRPAFTVSVACSANLSGTHDLTHCPVDSVSITF